MNYGVNVFYLPKTNISGNITQENKLTNLGYGYGITQVPVYATAKALMMNHSDQYGLTADVGIGPNFIKTTSVHEWPINNSNGLSNHVFSGRSNTSFSAMAGVGLRINHVFGEAPLECGYRYHIVLTTNLRGRIAPNCLYGYFLMIIIRPKTSHYCLQIHQE